MNCYMRRQNEKDAHDKLKRDFHQSRAWVQEVADLNIGLRDQIATLQSDNGLLQEEIIEMEEYRKSTADEMTKMHNTCMQQLEER